MTAAPGERALQPGQSRQAPPKCLLHQLAAAPHQLLQSQGAPQRRCAPGGPAAALAAPAPAHVNSEWYHEVPVQRTFCMSKPAKGCCLHWSPKSLAHPLILQAAGSGTALQRPCRVVELLLLRPHQAHACLLQRTWPWWGVAGTPPDAAAKPGGPASPLWLPDGACPAGCFAAPTGGSD